MDERIHPAIPWPGFRAERAFVLPLRAERMATPFGDRCEVDGIVLRRKGEFHVTVFSREMSRAAAAAVGEPGLRALYEALHWAPLRTGRYALLHDTKSTDVGPLACWSLIEHMELPAMRAFRAELAHALGRLFADPVPHVTHFVRGDPNGIGVPDTHALAGLLVRELTPVHHPVRTPPRPHWPRPASEGSFMQEPIEPGYMVFVADGEMGVGAVREVHADSRELVVNIENGGDFTLPASAIRDVHEGKVILDTDKLPESVRHALHHPHDAEYPEYAAEDPKDGALDP